ncbi:MAG: hypothetical protein ABI846_14625 [Rudaea sp.]
MNAKIIAIAIATGFIALSANAQDPQTSLSAVDVSGNAPLLVVNCRHEQLPSRDAIGGVLETNNASAIYAGREVVVHYAHRECMRGAGSVAFVRDASATTPALAMVDTAARR